MALETVLTFEQSDDGKQLLVSDITGAYDATDNTGGWGSPNVAITNVTSATISVLLPGGTVGTDEVIVDLETQVPNSTYQFKLLQAQSFGLTTDAVLPDGTYIIDYSVVNSVGPVTNTYHTEITLFNTAGKCVNDLLARIAGLGCDCDNTLMELAVQADVVLDAVRAAAHAQRPAEVTKGLLLLDKICDQVNNCLLDVCA